MSQPIAKRSNKAQTRFEIQFVFESGAYLRLTSRKDKPLTHAEAMKSIREFLAIIEKSDEKVRSKAEPEGGR